MIYRVVRRPTIDITDEAMGKTVSVSSNVWSMAEDIVRLLQPGVQHEPIIAQFLRRTDGLSESDALLVLAAVRERQHATYL